MILSRTIPETRSRVNELKKKKGQLGLVPTMGSLHEGHISLVRKSTAENAATAVSIFVNPTQFNEKQDFESYPRNLEGDLARLGDLKVDLVFAPDAAEFYPEADERVFDFGGLDSSMEGKYRPGHFNGVAQAVTRLFDIIEPDSAYFGEKDFQQLAIIRKLVRDLKIPVRIVGCPIVREADGLAMSSRNKLLSADQRKSALRISEALRLARAQSGEVPVETLKKQTLGFLHQDPLLKAEYFEIVHAQDLKPVRNWSDEGRKIGCLAVKVGNVRLIDNMDFSL